MTRAMSDSVVWFRDMKQLVRSDKVTQFWPNNNQSTADRVNAASRFIVYATCILYAIRRDPRIFILGAMDGTSCIDQYTANFHKTSSCLQDRPLESWKLGNKGLVDFPPDIGTPSQSS